MTIDQTRVNYGLALGKQVPNNKKNDEGWMQAKIEEATPQIVKNILPEKASLDKKGSTVEVYGADDILIRVYTKDEHGSDYQKLAEAFLAELNK